MKRLILFLLFIFALISSSNAQQTSTLSKEVAHLNEIIKNNTKPTDGLKVVFSLDEKSHILNLRLTKNKPLGEETLQMFTLIPSALPIAIISTLYGISKNNLGSILLLKTLVDEHYKIKVTITDSNNESISYELSARELMNS